MLNLEIVVIHKHIILIKIIIFFDTINDFNQTSSEIIDKFDTKHNIDKEQYKKLYSQNEYKLYFKKVYDTYKQ